MSLNSRRNVICAALLALVLVSCSEEQPPLPPQKGAVTVAVLEAHPLTLTRTLPGRTSAFRTAEVRPQVDGIIEDRLFTEGDWVEAGQPLYQINDAIYRAELASAEAELSKAKASLKTLALKAERAEKLVKNNTVSRQHYDDAMAALGEGEAVVMAAEAMVDNAKIRVGYASISAPISGRIGKSSVTPGALVTANQAASLATIHQLDPIYVDMPLSSSEWLALKQAATSGQLDPAAETVTILLEDGTRYDQMGTLQFAGVDVTPSTGSILLRVLVPNPENLLLPGMYVRAEVNTGTLKQALLVPQKGVTRDPKGNALALVVDSEGKVEQRSISVGQAIGSDWLVKSGLSAGDRVIVEGLQKVRPGMPVDATEATQTRTDS